MTEQQYQIAWQDTEDRLRFVEAVFWVFHGKSSEERQSLERFVQIFRREAVRLHELRIQLNIARAQARHQ